MAICDWCKQEMTDPKVKTCCGNSKVEFPDGLKLDAIAFYPYNLSPKQLVELAEMHPELTSEGGVIRNDVLSPSPGERCRDCNVTVGGFHHPGCDNERCPRCRHQLISCGCLEEDDT